MQGIKDECSMSISYSLLLVQNSFKNPFLPSPVPSLLTNFHIQLKVCSCSSKKESKLPKIPSSMKLKEIPTKVFRKKMKETTNPRLHLTYLRMLFKYTPPPPPKKPKLNPGHAQFINCSGKFTPVMT